MKLYPTEKESLVWVNGMGAGSFGWGHREVPLSLDAQAGTRYEILMESYAGHGVMNVGEAPVAYGVESVPEPGSTQTVVQKSTFGIWLEEIYQAALDFTTLFDLSQRLDPLSLRVCEIDEALMEVTMIIGRPVRSHVHGEALSNRCFQMEFDRASYVL